MAYYTQTSSFQDIKIDTLSILLAKSYMPYIFGQKLILNLFEYLEEIKTLPRSIESSVDQSEQINNHIRYIKNFDSLTSNILLSSDVVDRTNTEYGEITTELLVSKLGKVRNDIETLPKDFVKQHTLEGPFTASQASTLVVSNTAIGEVPYEIINNGLVLGKDMASLLGGTVSPRIVLEGISLEDADLQTLNNYPYTLIVTTKEMGTVNYGINNSGDIDTIKDNLQTASAIKYLFTKEKIIFNNIGNSKQSSIIVSKRYKKFTYTGTIPNKNDVIVINGERATVKDVLGNSITVNEPIPFGSGYYECIVRNKWQNIVRRLRSVHIPNREKDHIKEIDKLENDITSLSALISNFSYKDQVNKEINSYLEKVKKVHLSNSYSYPLYLLEECLFMDYYSIDDSEATEDRFKSSSLNKVRTVGI